MSKRVVEVVEMAAAAHMPCLSLLWHKLAKQRHVCGTVHTCTPLMLSPSPAQLLIPSWERKYDAFMAALRRQQDRLDGSSADPGIAQLVSQELGKAQGLDQLGLR